MEKEDEEEEEKVAGLHGSGKKRIRKIMIEILLVLEL
jgi:hypothetical protein